jgi:hypothetical protein
MLVRRHQTKPPAPMAPMCRCRFRSCCCCCCRGTADAVLHGTHAYSIRYYSTKRTNLAFPRGSPSAGEDKLTQNLDRPQTGQVRSARYTWYAAFHDRSGGVALLQIQSPWTASFTFPFALLFTSRHHRRRAIFRQQRQPRTAYACVLFAHQIVSSARRYRSACDCDCRIGRDFLQDLGLSCR